MKKAKNIFQFSALLLTLVLVQNIKVMAKIKNLVGKTYGKLTVISFSHSKDGSYWNCRCSCGNEFIATASSLNYGKKSCRKCVNKTHGMSHTKEFSAWSAMKDRCRPDHKKYSERYHKRGIIVCGRWDNSFDNFLSDMGKSPSAKHSIDRINNDGNYEPENCRWATSKEQNNNLSTNTVIEYNGEKKTLTQWAEFLKINPETLRHRVKYRGWSITDAFTRPIDLKRTRISVR